jgi:DNA repair exonuclease SbcCD ATPase subunit
MKDIQELLHTKLTSRDLIKEQMGNINLDLDKLNLSLTHHIEAREIIQKAAQLTQKSLEVRLSEIVSEALELVFDDLNLGLSVQFVPKRNSTECEMYITEDGEEYDPLGSCGFGVADVASFTLRVAMWSLNKNANIMIFDEPFRNLDDDRISQAALLLTTLSTELDIQMVVVTHEDALKEHAGKSYVVTKKNGVCKVK